MKMVLRTIGVLMVSAVAADAQTVYNNNGASTSNLSGNTAIWNTPTNCSSLVYCGSYIGRNDVSAGYNGGGTGLTFENQNVVTLSLAGLGAHTGGTLFFTLFVIDSWDGNAYGCCGPDLFSVSVNGNQLLHTTFTDPAFGSTDYQAYPDPFQLGPPGPGTGNTNAPGSGAAENGSLGSWYWTGATTDNSVYTIAIPFVDASSTLTIDFAGSDDNQGFRDESWGLQHVQVDLDGRNVTATPEPASLALFATGFAGLGLAARRRKRNAAE